MYEHYNPNPSLKNVGDCTIRAMTKALNQDWDTVYAELSAMGYGMKDMPSSNAVWGALLKQKGWKRHIVDDKGKDTYTVIDFCRDNPIGKYVLAIQGHIVCIIDGNYYDSWDSGHEIPLYYWMKG